MIIRFAINTTDVKLLSKIPVSFLSVFLSCLFLSLAPFYLFVGVEGYYLT
jgi:hypothetical protein